MYGNNTHILSGFAAVVNAESKGNRCSPIITSSILTAYILTLCGVKIKAIFLKRGGIPHIFMALHTRYYMFFTTGPRQRTWEWLENVYLLNAG